MARQTSFAFLNGLFVGTGPNGSARVGMFPVCALALPAFVALMTGGLCDIIFVGGTIHSNSIISPNPSAASASSNISSVGRDMSLFIFVWGVMPPIPFDAGAIPRIPFVAAAIPLIIFVGGARPPSQST